MSEVCSTCKGRGVVSSRVIHGDDVPFHEPCHCTYPEDFDRDPIALIYLILIIAALVVWKMLT